MKFFLSFLISFFFIFATNLDVSDVVGGYFKNDQKTTVGIVRSVAPHKVVQKQLYPGSWDLKILSAISAAFKNQNLFLVIYNHREVSNYVSSGAQIYQNIAST